MKYLFVVCFLFQVLTSAASAQSYQYHTVKKGETVFSISQAYSLDEEDIYKYNPGARDGIGLNEKLVIPIDKAKSNTAVERATTGTTTSFKEHKVRKKETLYSLSKQYDVSIDDLKRYNKQLYSKELQIGEVIQIPVGNGSETVQQPTENNSVAAKTESTSAKETQNSSETRPKQISKTREHIVLPKETKYGIARKYGMTLNELDELNPMVNVLQPGMMIRVGTQVLDDEPVIITDDRFRFYEVKPQENLFRLSQRFGVSQDSLIELNPALKDGLKFGMILKVPNTEGEAEEPVEIDQYTGRGENADTRMELGSSISNRKTKELVLMLPYHLNKVQADSLPTYRSAIMNERVIRISLDFYSGVLMAVDKAKEMGISTNLRVYDTDRNTSAVTNIINSNNFDNVDAVIGPLIQDVSEAAAGQLENRNIPVINPLSNRSMRGYKNLFQSRPSEDYMRSRMIEYMANNAAGKNVLVVADSKSSATKNQILSAIPSARAVGASDSYISESKLAEMMTSGENWIILETENVNLIASATAALNRLARSRNITLLTTNKSSGYENDLVSNNHLGKLKMHYPSVDKEFDTDATKDFMELYDERFHIQPNQYAIRGYDLTLDVLLRLASAEDLYESFEKYPGYTEYYESKFHYLRRPEGGFVNDAIYILKLNEDLTISKANDF